MVFVLFLILFIVWWVVVNYLVVMLFSCIFCFLLYNLWNSVQWVLLCVSLFSVNGKVIYGVCLKKQFELVFFILLIVRLVCISLFVSQLGSDGLMLNIGDVNMVLEKSFGMCSKVNVFIVLFIEWYINNKGFCCLGLIMVFINVIKLFM